MKLMIINVASAVVAWKMLWRRSRCSRCGCNRRRRGADTSTEDSPSTAMQCGLGKNHGMMIVLALYKIFGLKADKEIKGYDYRVVVVVVSGGGRRPWWWYEVNECEEGRKDMKMNHPYLNVNSTDRFGTAMCVEWHCRKLCG